MGSTASSYPSLIHGEPGFVTRGWEPGNLAATAWPSSTSLFVVAPSPFSVFLFHFPLLLFGFGFSLFLSFSCKKKEKISPPNFWKDREYEVYKMQRREKKKQDLFMEKRNKFVQGIKRELKRERELLDCSQEEVLYKSPLFFLPFVFLLRFLFFSTSRYTFKWLFMRETVDLVRMQQISWCFIYLKTT